ncbi:hypothetical protein [Ferdinandcohnia sp. Marseille-Q9671]
MNQDRKKIILNEILYWRDNKLLPETYCNFLITLYSEGEGVEASKPSTSVTGKTYVYLFGIGLLLPFLFLVTYFTEISPILQMVINFIFIIICILSVILNRNNPLLLHLGTIILALFILILSVNGSEMFFKGQGVYLLFTVLLNCVAWLFIGVFSKKKYFLFAGLIGGFVTVILLLNI